MKKTKEYGRIGVCLCGVLLIIGTVCMGGCEAKAERITEDVFVIGGEDEEMYESNGHADEQLPPAFQLQGENAAATDSNQPPATQEKAEQNASVQIDQNNNHQTSNRESNQNLNPESNQESNQKSNQEPDQKTNQNSNHAEQTNQTDQVKPNSTIQTTSENTVQPDIFHIPMQENEVSYHNEVKATEKENKEAKSGDAESLHEEKGDDMSLLLKLYLVCALILALAGGYRVIKPFISGK